MAGGQRFDTEDTEHGKDEDMENWEPRYLDSPHGLRAKQYNPRMRNFLIVVFVALMLAGAAAGQKPPCPPSAISRINILDVTIIDVVSGAEQTHVTVKLAGERIAQIVPYAAQQRSECAQIVEGAGKFLIPGLWDMHVHTFFGTWVPGGREVTIPLFAANGITGVRDMGSELDLILQARADIAAEN